MDRHRPELDATRRRPVDERLHPAITIIALALAVLVAIAT
jgi:hypothetical protein